jgi:hypothetical protein
MPVGATYTESQTQQLPNTCSVNANALREHKVFLVDTTYYSTGFYLGIDKEEGA